jgi:hypothetical protein
LSIILAIALPATGHPSANNDFSFVDSPDKTVGLLITKANRNTTITANFITLILSSPWTE